MALREQRGVVLIQVAILLVVLAGLAAFSFDTGAAWVGRTQAQTAADAGALAGATALAVDDRTWPFPPAGVVETSALGVASVSANRVGGYAAGTVVTAIAQCPPHLVAPNNTHCVQVDVLRDGTNASGTLPTYFANVFGVGTQGVKATATAQVAAATGSGCMRPWFIVDKYLDNNGNNTYDAGDVYTSPGYSVPADIGLAVQFHKNGGPSSYGQLDVGSGGNDIRNAITGCYAGMTTFGIGQNVWAEPGNKLGPEKQGVDDLFLWDPDYDPVTEPNGVRWDSTTNTVTGGCAASGTCACPSTPAQCPYGGTKSPRIVQAAICAPTQATCNGTVPGRNQILIVNILSFFITGYSVNSGDMVIEAVLMSSSGTTIPGGSAGPPGAAFVTVTRLVR